MTNILVNYQGKVYTKMNKKASNKVYLYATLCNRCGDSLEVQKQRVYSHHGVCRTCSLNKNRVKSTKGISKRNREELKLIRLKRREEIDKRKRITVKAKGLGTLINEFDNQLDNSVDAFNKKFDEYIGGDQTLEVEILEMYTHNGRKLKIDGVVFNHLFFDEKEHAPLPYFIDVYDRKDKFIKRYMSAHTIARDYDISSGAIHSAINNRHNSELNIKFKKVERVGIYRERYEKAITKNCN